MSQTLQIRPIVAVLGVFGFEAVPLSAHAQCVEGCTAIHTLVGQAAGDLFGWEAKALGDVNSDGIDDFIVSATGRDEAGFNSGKVYVYSGATGAELWSRNGTAANGQFGFSSNRAGDLNNDGVTDVIVGQPSVASGSVRVLSGVDGVLLRTIPGEASGDLFGYRSVGGGDVNGDGTADILVGAPRHDAIGNNAGRVYVHSGSDYSLLGTVDGESSADQHGTALGFLGDRDFDGRDEFIVCAKNAGATAGGRAYVYRYDGIACVLVTTIEPPANSVDFSEFLCNGEHDLNRDGVPDFYVSDFQTNRAYVYSGDTFDRLQTFTGDGTGQFGIGELSPDIDNDGHADAILAAWLSNEGGTQAGKAFVYSGRTRQILETLTHNVAGATFGYDAVVLGDVNGDRRSDYLITAASDAGSRGTVYVIAGTVTPLLDGDLDFSGCVELGDLAKLLTDFGCIGPACVADLDRNGTTDLPDLANLLANFGACSP